MSIAQESGAESGARGAREAPIDPGLAAVVEAWRTLPEHIRAAIGALVSEAAGLAVPTGDNGDGPIGK